MDLKARLDIREFLFWNRSADLR